MVHECLKFLLDFVRMYIYVVNSPTKERKKKGRRKKEREKRKAVPTKQGGPIWISVTIPKADKVMYTSVILALHRLGRQASSLGDRPSSSFSNRLHLMGIRWKHLPLVNL